MKKVWLVLLLLAIGMAMTGCYFNREIGTNEVGVQMDDGVSINAVVPPGRYTKMSWYASMKTYDGSSKTLEWLDSDVWTSDKQVISFKATVVYARKIDEESVRYVWKNYSNAAVNDKHLETLVSSKVPEAVKRVSTTLKLDEMLGIGVDMTKNRETFKQSIIDLLSPSLEACGVSLISFTIDNIGVDPTYQAKMQEKATASLEADLAKQKEAQLTIQLAQEKAQTEIDLEKARRTNLVAEEEAKVFKDSPEAYELERLRLLQGVIGSSDKIYFIPEGVDITLFLGGQTDAKYIGATP